MRSTGIFLSSSWTPWQTNYLVEEFMPPANTSVAGKIYEAFSQTAMLRLANPPPHWPSTPNQLPTSKASKTNSKSARGLTRPICRPLQPFLQQTRAHPSDGFILSAEYFSSATRATLNSDTTFLRAGSTPTSHPPSTAIRTSFRTSNLWSHYTQNSTQKRNLSEYAERSTTDVATRRCAGRLESIFVRRVGVEGLICMRDLAPDEQKSAFGAEDYPFTVEGSAESRSVGLFGLVEVSAMGDVEECMGKGRIKMTLVS
ncbi:unnamed protein product [Tuber melanosporum]|uniref:(Perigord truffle) hypothetical protein n=1 Tax=Tuber melanosporum (strain Mel28) TaxID=656061 RepID=D5GJ18_TUBMM|nr:uncharacterized protein GSTUM_00008779001 [Tuber melanosporum]CAZ84511.1 unnamed protein product [Tuber melanosporum]